jgi:hypothetical protein
MVPWGGGGGGGAGCRPPHHPHQNRQWLSVTMRITTVLPTRRLFGHITQRGRINSGAAGQICGRKIAFLRLIFLNLCKFKKYYTFPTVHRKLKITRVPNYFLSGRIFPPNWPERPAKGWQHWKTAMDSSTTFSADFPVH